MAFTNVWDTTQPPDSQLANQLGLDLRNFRLDVQQRMGSLSGLDAAKPNFAGDAQPANWNGMLFFATDTGKIYQFVNPAWTDVTGSLKAPSGVLYKNTTPVVHTGTTSIDTIYTTAIPILTTTSILRITFSFVINTQGVVGATLNILLGATILGQLSYVNNVMNNTVVSSVLHIFNANSLVVQSADMSNSYRGADGVNGIINTSGAGIAGAVNTAVASSVTLQLQNGVNSDQQTFRRFMVELL
jgi:hypothetical protein